MPEAAQTQTPATVVQTTGAEFLKFYNDPKVWGEDTFMEGVLLRVNGKLLNGDADGIDYENLAPTDELVIEGGGILDEGDRDEDLTAAFLNWRREQTDVLLSVSIPKEREQELRAMLALIGGKLL